MNPSYSETLEYLYTRLPVFQHIGKAAYKANLDNTIALASALGNPEKKIQTIHIAGTNGKGSVSSLLAAIFTTHGFKTGLYTSPHLKDFRERIRIDGVMIPEQAVVDFTERIKPIIEQISPSFFEITFAMATDYFATQEVDIAIIETGMGGRLDSTNIVSPLLSIITNIGWDHMEFLGDTRAKIASEKAGIIKPETPVVIGESDNETTPEFYVKSEENKAPIFFADQAPETWIDAFALKGNYQKKNLATVYRSLQVLEEFSGYQFDENKTTKALQNVVQLSGIRGRWETLRKEPLTICDTAHNEHGLREVISQLTSLKANKIHLVIGVVNDKDLTKILPLMPKDAIYYFCRPNIMRGMEAQVLQQIAEAYGLNGAVYASVVDAMQAAINAADKKDIVFVGGSTFVVAEAIS